MQLASLQSGHDVFDIAHSINFDVRLKRKQRAKVAGKIRQKCQRKMLRDADTRASSYRVLKLDRLAALPPLAAGSVALYGPVITSVSFTLLTWQNVVRCIVSFFSKKRIGATIP